MPKRYVHNDTAAVMFVAGRMLQPGEGREIDGEELPPEGADTPGAIELQIPSAEEVAQALQAGTVVTITAALPGLDAETLDALEMLEAAQDNPRVTLQQAIAAERLDRAKAAAEAGTGAGSCDPGAGAGEGGAS